MATKTWADQINSKNEVLNQPHPDCKNKIPFIPMILFIWRTNLHYKLVAIETELTTGDHSATAGFFGSDGPS
jgi:hypothetical protein